MQRKRWATTPMKICKINKLKTMKTFTMEFKQDKILEMNAF
jgi:hypothetical protein